jgi:drug/metabolite transporter (DMT)-like permease
MAAMLSHLSNWPPVRLARGRSIDHPHRIMTASLDPRVEQNEIGRGMALMAVAMTVLPVMDVLAKLLGQKMPVLEVTLSRFAVQAVLAVIAALAIGKPSTLLPPRMVLHALRGLLLAGATLLFFAALKVMPIPDTLGIFFTEPLILTALSTVVLGERVGWRRWLAVVVGFIGALFIIRPSWAVFGLTALLPLGAAFLFAGYLLLTRRLRLEGSLLAAQFITGIAGTVALGSALLLASLFGPEQMRAVVPDGIEWLQLFSIGAISFVAHGLVVLAFRYAPAASLAPLNYMEIVSATLLSYLVFDQFPVLPVWVGIAIIVGSGLYVAHRERRKAMVMDAAL